MPVPRSAEPDRVVVVCEDTGAAHLAERLVAGLLAQNLRVSLHALDDIPQHAFIVIVVGTNDNGDMSRNATPIYRRRKFIRVVPKARNITILTSTPLLGPNVADLLFADSCDIIDELVTRIVRWLGLESILNSADVTDRIIGNNSGWLDLISDIVEVAHFTNDSVLLLGDSGTGKELLARLVHDLDGRKNKGSYVLLDCTTIVSELSGSEFFGHERGAFTGAYTSRDGAFAVADGGTLFLDEIGELPLPLQAQLLRVIQEGTYRRVGSNAWRRTNFRLVCATNRDLAADVTAGRFRSDLYYRIAQWTFQLPALSARRDDIVPLALYFLNEGHPADQRLRFDPLVERYLMSREYPGNIRELKLLVSRLRFRHSDAGIVSIGCVPLEERQRFCSDSANGSNIPANANARATGGLPLNQVKLETIRSVMEQELASVNYDPKKRPLVIRRTHERLGCSRRWIQICDKKHSIIQSLVAQNK